MTASGESPNRLPGFVRGILFVGACIGTAYIAADVVRWGAREFRDIRRARERELNRIADEMAHDAHAEGRRAGLREGAREAREALEKLEGEVAALRARAPSPAGQNGAQASA